MLNLSDNMPVCYLITYLFSDPYLIF